MKKKNPDLPQLEEILQLIKNDFKYVDKNTYLKNTMEFIKSNSEDLEKVKFCELNLSKLSDSFDNKIKWITYAIMGIIAIIIAPFLITVAMIVSISIGNILLFYSRKWNSSFYFGYSVNSPFQQGNLKHEYNGKKQKFVKLKAKKGTDKNQYLIYLIPKIKIEG